MRDEQLIERLGKMRQPRGQCRLGIRGDPPVGYVREAIALGEDDAPAGRPEPRIEAEDDQANFSITSSEIS